MTCCINGCTERAWKRPDGLALFCKPHQEAIDRGEIKG